MSILTELLARKITFSQARAKVTPWLARTAPIVTPAVQDAVEDAVLQGASNMVDLSTTALGGLLGPAMDTVQAAASNVLRGYLPAPVGVALLPAANDAVDRIQGALQAQVAAWALEAKAQIAEAQAVNASRPQVPPAR